MRNWRSVAVLVAVFVFGAALGAGVLALTTSGKNSLPSSFDPIKGALGRRGANICRDARDPSMTFGPVVGATDARSYFLAPCPNGGIVAVGDFPDETVRDEALRYLLGLDKASFTPDKSGPIWKQGWRLGTFGVVIAADTPPAATKQVDRAMTTLHAEPVGAVPGGAPETGTSAPTPQAP